MRHSTKWREVTQRSKLRLFSGDVDAILPPDLISKVYSKHSCVQFFVCMYPAPFDIAQTRIILVGR